MPVHRCSFENIGTEVLFQDRSHFLSVFRKKLFERRHLAFRHIIRELPQGGEDIHFLSALQSQIDLLGIIGRTIQTEIHLYPDLFCGDRIDCVCYLAQIIRNPVE
ncbi:hypothetical protein D3C75_526500 [compost metagenome]